MTTSGLFYILYYFHLPKLVIVALNIIIFINKFFFFFLYDSIFNIEYYYNCITNINLYRK